MAGLFGLAGGGKNLYGFVANDPVNWAELSGLKLKLVDGAPGGIRLGAYIPQVRSTKKGASLLKKLENRKEACAINLNPCGKILAILIRMQAL
jgi:hypothetical protein